MSGTQNLFSLTRAASINRRRVKSQFPCRSLFLTVWLSLALADVARAEWHLWTLTETRHVLRSDPPATGTSVKLGAARNEWVNFQILLRSDEPVNGVSVEAGDLQGPGGALLRRACGITIAGGSEDAAGRRLPDLLAVLQLFGADLPTGIKRLSWQYYVFADGLHRSGA
jgi:hypothetical protein